jgi:hypothetical protein
MECLAFFKQPLIHIPVIVAHHERNSRPALEQINAFFGLGAEGQNIARDEDRIAGRRSMIQVVQDRLQCLQIGVDVREDRYPAGLISVHYWLFPLPKRLRRTVFLI